MDHLTQAQLDQLRHALEQEQAQLTSRVTADDEDAAADEELGDFEDKAAAEARRTTARRRQAHGQHRLAEVEAALRRIADGSYGLCEETDEPIPFARLATEPTTRYTVEALELLEQERRQSQNLGHPDAETDAY